MSHRSDLILLIIVGVLTCSNLVKTDDEATDELPTNTSTVSGPDDPTTSTSIEDISSSSLGTMTASPPPSSTTTATTTTTTTAKTTPESTEAITTLPPQNSSTTTAEVITVPITTTTAFTTETLDLTTTTAAAPDPTTSKEEATLCPNGEESFFGKHGLIVFIVALGIILLLFYTILMLLLLPKILKRSRKGGKYTLSKGGRKSKDHQGIPPLVIGADEDTQSTSKAIDPGPLMLVTAMDSVAFASEQDDDDGDDDGQSNGPLNPSKGDTRKDSSDQGNVSTFLLRQTSIRQAEERKRTEAEANQNLGTSNIEGSAMTATATTEHSPHMDGNANLFDDHMTPVLSPPLYGVNNEITEV